MLVVERIVELSRKRSEDKVRKGALQSRYFAAQASLENPDTSEMLAKSGYVDGIIERLLAHLESRLSEDPQCSGKARRRVARLERNDHCSILHIHALLPFPHQRRVMLSSPHARQICASP